MEIYALEVTRLPQPLIQPILDLTLTSGNILLCRVTILLLILVETARFIPAILMCMQTESRLEMCPPLEVFRIMFICSLMQI